MREIDLLEGREPMAAAAAGGGGRPLADAVDGEHRGLLEAGVEEGAGGVRGVVRVGAERPLVPQALAQRALRAARIEPWQVRRQVRRHAGPQLAGELLLRQLVVGEAVDLVRPDAAGRQAEAEGGGRQARVVPHAGEALLLGRSHQAAVLQQAAGRLVEEGGDADDVHRWRASPPRRLAAPAPRRPAARYRPPWPALSAAARTGRAPSPCTRRR